MNCANHPDREQTAFCQNCGKPICQECTRVIGTAVFCEPCLAARLSGAGAPPPAGGGTYTYTGGEGGLNYNVTGAIPAPGEPNPGLAALLGLIPGVGAMYNGQYAKGVVHLIVFAILVSLANENGIFGLFIAGWVCYQVIEAYHTAKARRDGTPLPNPFGLNDLSERLGFGKSWPASGAAAPHAAAPDATQTQTTGSYTPPPPNYPPPPGAGWGAPWDSSYAVPPVPPYAAGYPDTPGYPGYPGAPGYPGNPLDPNLAPVRNRFPAGAIWLIGLGCLFLIGNSGLFHTFPVHRLVPFFLIGLGVWLFVRRMTDTGTGIADDGTPGYQFRLFRALRGSVWVTLIGVLFLLDSFGIVSWGHSWPIIIIVAGLMAIFQRVSYNAAMTPAYPYPASPAPPPPQSPPPPGTSIVPSNHDQEDKAMGNYPPPPYPPPAGPPYGGDWKYQRRVLKEQARAQRDMLRAQREAYRYQSRGMRRSSILGPLVLISVGIVFLLVQTGRLQGYRLWEWYGHFWPFLLVGAGIVMLIEWAYDQHVQSDPTQPRYRRRVGGGVFTILILLAFVGLVLSGARTDGRSKLFNGLSINQDNWDEFMGDKHESDQTIAQTFPTGGSLVVNNPRGDVTITGTSDDNQIHVAVHKEVYTRSDSEADAKAQRLSPNISVNGNNLTLNVPGMEGGRAGLMITLPANAVTTVNANHGDVKVTALKAPVTISANHGDVELSAITGDITARLNNSGSNIAAHSVTGSLTVEGHSHDSTISDLNGPLTMRGEFFGDAHFERIRGPLKFHTSRTDFQLGRLDGQIDISSSAALSTSEAVGPLTLTTHSRNITLDRVAGDVSVTNRNGSVDVTSAPPLSNVTVENRNGSVSITVPEQANFAYQFDATNGDIESDFSQVKSTEQDSRKNTVSGTIGKGGPLLRVTTSQGDVSLKKASIMPLPPMPPMPPKLTALPPEARQAIDDANRTAREATAEARQAAKEAQKEAAAAAKEAKQQNKNPNQ